MLSMSHKANLLILPATVLPNRAWLFTMQAFLQEKAYEQSSIHLRNQSEGALASPMLLARWETATVSQLESAREKQFRREGSVWNMELWGGCFSMGLAVKKKVTAYKAQGSACYGQIVQPFRYALKML